MAIISPQSQEAFTDRGGVSGLPFLLTLFFSLFKFNLLYLHLRYIHYALKKIKERKMFYV